MIGNFIVTVETKKPSPGHHLLPRKLEFRFASGIYDGRWICIPYFVCGDKKTQSDPFFETYNGVLPEKEFVRLVIEHYFRKSSIFHATFDGIREKEYIAFYAEGDKCVWTFEEKSDSTQ